jgi:polysaccharide pyruvyl transferase WcaK-like protein
VDYLVKKGKTIFITGLHRTIDNGELSLLLGFLEGLKQTASEEPIALRIFCDYDGLDVDRIKESTADYSFKVIPVVFRWPWLEFVLPLFRLTSYFFLIRESDFVVHLGADGFSDESHHPPLSVIHHSLQLLMAHFLGKPTFILSSNLGPFNSSFSKRLGAFTLKRTNGITIREGHSALFLKELGIKNFVMAPDIAFLINGSNRFLRSVGCSPCASIVVNYHIPKKFPKYVDTMASVVDLLCEKGFHVFIIPQIVYGKFNEIPLTKAIYQKSSKKEHVTLVEALLPVDMTQIFRCSKIVISSKYHSSILALTTRTPTICLSYHYKVKDLYDMLDLPECVVELTSDTDLFLADVSKKVDSFADGSLQKKIDSSLDRAKKDSILNMSIIQETVNF